MTHLRAIYDRAAIFALRGGLPFTADKSLTTPVEDIRDYLSLNKDGFQRKQHFGIRIEYGMRVNFNERPAVTLGFESSPDQKLVRRTARKDETSIGRGFGNVSNYVDEAFGNGGGGDEPEIFHASQSVIVTDYRKAINRHGFAVMVCGRMTNYQSDLPVVFGLTAVYDKAGNCDIRRLSVPEFGTEGKTALRDLPVTRENIVLALNYARLCTQQVYRREVLTPQRNWNMALETIAEHALKMANEAVRNATNPPPAP